MEIAVQRSRTAIPSLVEAISDGQEGDGSREATT
jgi:hypothetical protein